MAFSGYDPSSPQEFARLAELQIRGARNSFGFELHYDLESLKKLDTIVEAIGTPRDRGQMVMVIGSFLGEGLRHIYGGKWVWNEQYQTWGIALPKKVGGETCPFPFAKVEKRFLNGKQDSISFFVEVTDGIVSGRVPG